MKRFLTIALLLLFVPLLSACAYRPETAAEPDYLGLMVQSAVGGDLEAGHLAEYRRSHSIDERGSGEVKIAFEELYLLARLIDSETQRHSSDELRMCVGEVVLNRVASPEYPDSLEAVIYQEGQYAMTGTAAFKTTPPSRASTQAALRLLLGERVLAPRVVIQSRREQANVYAQFCEKQGFLYLTTYFCASPNAELYPADPPLSIYSP